MSTDDRLIDFTPEVTDEDVRFFVRGEAPITRLFEEKDGAAWSFFNGATWKGREIGGNLEISRRRPTFRSGYTYPLRPESRFYKRWFDFPDLGKRGWALILRAFEPEKAPEALMPDETNGLSLSEGDAARMNFINSGRRAEFIAGWLPPDSEAQVDTWIALLNAEIQIRVNEERAKGRAERADGGT